MGCVSRSFCVVVRIRTHNHPETHSYLVLIRTPTHTRTKHAEVHAGNDVVADDPDERRIYGVYGVLVHKGVTANSGHYFCYARHSNGISRDF